jgi:DNA repair exonuclease SbcCD ATPase subunit
VGSVKYKSIELYNYAGIYNGMGLTQLKIDFTKCITNKIIIKGKNGSGKSTLLNAINPNPDSNDNFIPNTEARKIITLSENGIDYVIRYIHPVNNNGVRGTTKGYISKTIDGQLVELNPNGNISSCKDILYNEFNLDSNYLSLARLTTENRGLVDSKPAERKKLVNSIIHNLETYNNIFKILSKKASTYKSLITSLTSKIDYIGNEVQLNAKLQNIDSRIVSLEEEKNTTIEAIAAIKIKISEYIQILRDNNYDDIVEELKSINITVRNLRNSINTQLENYKISDINNIKPFIDNIEKQIVTLETKRDTLKTRIPILLTERESEYKNLQSKQEQLNSLQSDYNYADIKQVTDNARKVISEYDEVFKQMKLDNINLITKTEFDSAMESLRYLKESAYNVISSYTIEDIIPVVINRQQVLSNIRSIPSLKIKLESSRKSYNAIDREYTKFVSKRELAAELINRPKECKIDSCPYIESAVKANNEYPESKMLEMEKELKDLKWDMNNIEGMIDKYTLFSEILSYITNIERELNSKIGFIKKLPIRHDFQQTFLQRVCQLDKFEDIDELYKFVDCGNMIEEYKSAQEQLRKYEAEYKLYESRNNIIESILLDIEKLSKKINNIADELDSDNNTIVEIENTLDALQNTKQKLFNLFSKINDSLIPSESRQEELNKIKSTLDSNTSELNNLEIQLGKLNANNNAIINDIKTLTNERDNIRHSLVMLNDYRKELIEYQDKFVKVEKIRYYSSSSTGIQTLYMQLYMNKILSTANDLLSMLFDGEFALQPFVINEQEFRIPCLGSGLLHDDISSMSTAQKSMISMIISYSILYQSQSKYNVISLDEMDGSLDGSNRSYFMTLLDNLMNILRCEQCFIISHNSELISELADIIILKDVPGANYGGNVIWQY